MRTHSKFTLLCFLFVNLFIISSSSFGAELKWSVVNRFPLFKNSSDFINLEMAWPKDESPESFLSHQNGISLRKLLPIRNTQWNPETGTYDHMLFNAYHSIKLSYKGADSDKQCIWSYNGKEQGRDVCSKDFIIQNVSDKESFFLSVQVDPSDPIKLENQKIKTELILGLGDSFSSGEGNPDYAFQFSSKRNKISPDWIKSSTVKGDKSAEWWDQACHRSLLSWQSLFAMGRAINNSQSVIQFATFACSGAEIYDGFFHAQINPPGALKREFKVPNVVWASKTDGGYTYKLLQGMGSIKIIEDKEVKAKLVKSQLNASIDLLCDGKVIRNIESNNYHTTIEGQNGKVFYGNFKNDQCIGELKSPDILLSSFGGNDVDFGSVVRWAVVPKTVRRDPLYLFRFLGLNTLRQSLTVVTPESAGTTVKNHLNKLYSNLDESLNDKLKLRDKNVKIISLVYPDPLPTDNFQRCSSNLAAGNEALGQLFGRGWTYNFDKPIAKEVSDFFIDPLQKKQQEIMPEKWTKIYAQNIIDGRSMCSVPPVCDNEDCKINNSYGWFHKGSVPYLKKYSEWEAYANDRSRGFRTANDAAMTQSTISKNGRLNLDWLAGSFHPTAYIHASIAENLNAIVDKSSQ